MLVIGTLVTRMFGQRSKASLTCNTVTLQEFSVHYPQLLDFVMQKLVKCERQTDEITGVQPSLFLILTLLSSLGPAVDSANSHRLTSQLSKQAMVVMASPVYFLRELSAACVVALTPLDATETCVNELLDRLEFKASARNRNNHIHGTLMCLEKLLNARPQSAGIAEQVTEFILVNTWLVSSDILCPLACLWTCVKDETDPTCAMIAAKILVTLSMEDCIYWHHMPVIDTREDLQPCYDLVATRARFHRLAGMVVEVVVVG
nr:hypothetical protein BaRGS_006875 [Batillaria attramentaria]